MVKSTLELRSDWQCAYGDLRSENSYIETMSRNCSQGVLNARQQSRKYLFETSPARGRNHSPSKSINNLPEFGGSIYSRGPGSKSTESLLQLKGSYIEKESDKKLKEQKKTNETKKKAVKKNNLK